MNAADTQLQKLAQEKKMHQDNMVAIQDRLVVITAMEAALAPLATPTSAVPAAASETTSKPA